MGWTPVTSAELSLQLPAYEVECLLGRGGMGAVYRAIQKSLKRTVAIKVLPLAFADDELKFAERFRHEAETLARLNHQCIVHIHDFGETGDGLLYLVMEYVDGTDVHQLIQANGRLSEDYALAVTAHVCDALAYAHSRGVVHRDIKPANVLIDQDGNVKVADFGLAKMIDPTFDSRLTMSNVALGTPDFVAPEVLSAGMTVDHRADLYAVGVMLYQMLTGEVPRGLFKLPSQRGFVSDERWDEIICRSMEADRDERYQSAVEVRHALDAIMTGVVVAKSPSEEIPPTRQGAPRKRGLVMAAGLFAFALIAALATFLALDRGNEATSAVQPEQTETHVEEAPKMAGSSKTVLSGPGEVAIISPGIEVPGLSRGFPTAPETIFPGIQWTDVTAKVREEAAANPKLVVEAGGIRRTGNGSPVGISVTDPSWRNYAIRIRHSADTQINLRGGDHGMVYVLNQKLKTLIHRHDAGATEAAILEAGIPHPSGFDINQTHELVATVEDNLFRAWVDGRPAGQVRDNALSTGTGMVVWVRQSVVHSVEIALLPESPHRTMRESFWGQIKDVNAERQVEIVEGALESINHNDLSIKPTIEGGKVTALNITQKAGEPLHDLSPVSSLTDLKIFFCYAPGVRDLDWLRGMPIEHLQLENASVEDFRPLRETKITHLDLDFPKGTPGDYSLLAGLPLRGLSLQKCPLNDLSFLSGMPLNRLVLTGTGITDYTPLKAFSLAEVDVDLVPERDLPILLSIPTLKKINGNPVEEYRGK